MKKLASIIITLMLLALTATSSFATVQLHSMDDLNGIGGTNNTIVVDGVLEGSGMVQTESDNLCIIQANFPEVDISEYAYDGGLHFWMYIEDADALNGNGQFEITSSGTCDEEENTWSIYDVAYEDGWNEIFLPFYNVSQEALDYEHADFFRMYNFVDYYTTIIIDDVSVGYEKDFPNLLEKLEPETEAPVEEEPADDEGAADDEYAEETDGAIEDRAEVEEDAFKDAPLYVGVLAFTAIILASTAAVVITAKKNKEQ